MKEICPCGKPIIKGECKPCGAVFATPHRYLVHGAQVNKRAKDVFSKKSKDLPSKKDKENMAKFVPQTNGLAWLFKSKKGIKNK